jgi:hypothetical protein
MEWYFSWVEGDRDGEVVEMLEGLVCRWVSVLKRRMRLLFIGEWRGRRRQ